MELYHLDWETANSRSSSELLDIILPTPDSEALRERASKAFADGLYRKVANIEAHSLQEVFASTQNLEDGWADNPAPWIRLCSNERQRSTSVGDVIVDDEGTPHVVSGMGFIEFTARNGMLPTQ